MNHFIFIFLYHIQRLISPTLPILVGFNYGSLYVLTPFSTFTMSITFNFVFTSHMYMFKPNNDAFFAIKIFNFDCHFPCWLILVSWPKVAQLTYIPFTTFATMSFVNSFPSSLYFGIKDFPYTMGYNSIILSNTYHHGHLQKNTWSSSKAKHLNHFSFQHIFANS